MHVKRGISREERTDILLNKMSDHFDKKELRKRLEDLEQVETAAEQMKILEEIDSDHPYCLDIIWDLFLYYSVHGNHKKKYKYNKKLLEAMKKSFNWEEVEKDKESRFIDVRIERDILEYKCKMINRRWLMVCGFMMFVIIVLINYR